MNTENLDNTPIKFPEIEFHIIIDEKGMRTGFKPANRITGGEILGCLSGGLYSLCAGIAEETGASTREIWEHLEDIINDSLPELDILISHHETMEDDGKEIL
jgi:hypothetical protein